MIKEYKDWLFVEMPKDAKNIIVVGNQVRWKMNALKFWYDLQPIPPGSWQIIGKGDGLTDLQASIITQEKHLPNGHLTKLLRSYGMETSETLVLKKNEK